MTDEPNYPQAPPMEPASPWAQPPASPSGAGGVPPTVPAPPWVAPPPEPAPPRGTAPAARALAVVIGLVAVGGGVAFAYQSLSDEGGAGSPEEAAHQLVDAVNDEDVLGVVDLLPEGERDLLRDLTTGARDEYQRLGLLSESFTLDGFPGVDIELTDLEFDVDDVTNGDGSDDGLAWVTVTDGDASIDVDGDELEGNLGDVVDAVADARDADVDADDVSEEDSAEGAAFAVIEEGGRWHPSLFFTIAEYYRQSIDGDGPDFGEGIEPAGEDSPEHAVQALLDAGVELDVEAAIALLDPGEARALHVYSQYFLPVDTEVPDDVEISAEITDFEVDDLDGGVRRVVPTGIEVHAEFEDGTFDVQVDGECASLAVDPPEGEEPIDEQVCYGDGADVELPDEFADIEVPEELQEVVEAFQPLRFGVLTVEHDGEHFVAPLRTVGDVLLGITRGLEPADLQDGGAVFALLSGDLDDEVEELFEAFADSAFAFEETEDFDDFDDDFGFDPDEDCEGVGCGFGDEDEPVDDGLPGRIPTGQSGPNGELLAFDVAPGYVDDGATNTYTAVAAEAGDYLIGAEGYDGFDSTIRVVDAETGTELASNDDFNDADPEVLVTLTAGQVVTVEVAGFAGGAGEYLVYFEPF